MSNPANILRQIKDFQAQSDRIILSKQGLDSYQDLSKYSEEIKNYLLENIKDKFILDHIHSIPYISLDSIERPDGGLIGKLAFFAGLGSLYHSHQNNDEILSLIREVKNKYASLEFLLRNYF